MKVPDKNFDTIESQFKTLRPQLIRYLVSHRLCRSSKEAEDIVGDVFARVLRSETEEHYERNSAYFCTACRNAALNLMRDEKRRQFLLDTKGSETLAPSSNEVDSELASFHGGIQDVLNSLTQDHRAILELRYQKDLAYLEIADTLQLQLGTVMSRLSRARAAFKKLAEGSPFLKDWLEGR